MKKEKKIQKLYRNYSEKIKEEGIYEHNYFLADLLILFREQKEITPEKIGKYWEKHEPENKSLYIHVPYCIKKCRYCIYSSRKPKNQRQINRYVENTLKELKYYSKKIDSPFKTLYIGGGTPSILPAQKISELLKEINTNYKFSEKAEKTFEMNPSTATPEKIETLKEHGINRISFGVQSIERKILQNENRGYQTNKMVKKAVKKASETGFQEINVDLIAGLEGSNSEDIRKSFKKMLETEADTVCIYPLQPNTSYLKKRGMTQKEFLKHLENLLEKTKKELKKLANRKNYKIPSLETDPRDANSWEFREKGHNPGFSKSYRFSGQDIQGCLGIGPESNSYIRNRIDYKRKETEEFKEKKPAYRGMVLKGKDPMRSYILNKAASKMKISKKGFQERFGKNIEKIFGKELQKMEETGIIEEKKDIYEIVPKNPIKIFSAFYFLFNEKQILNHIEKQAEKNRWKDILRKIKEINKDYS